MRRPKYPLDPLARVRKKGVDEATRRLADAVATRDGAEARERAAENERRGHEDRARAVREAERDALDRGDLRVGDLGVAAAWEVRDRAEAQALAQAEEKAHAEAASARAGQVAAQVGVAQRKADAEVVEKDRGRWEERLRKKAEAKEDEAAAEAWRRR